MTWTSPAMLGWIAATTLAAWALPRRFQPAAITALSAAFLAWASPLSAALLAGFAGASHFALGPRPGPARLWLMIGGVVAVLVAFKAGVETGVALDPADPAVPLGLSYFSIRVLHYTMERYKGTLPDHGFGHYVAYLFFLPILSAGPMTRFAEFRRDLGRRRFDAPLFSRGVERMLHGYAKIVLVANGLVSTLFGGWLESRFPEPTALGEYLDCFRYGLNLYFQFAGFSDVAIGFGLLLGFRVAENFRSPFLAPNIAEFWQRWHITLSSFCRDYVYLPVAASTRRPLVAVLAAMVVLGLWHELSARFLVWGAYHGLGIAAFRAFDRARAGTRAGRSRVGGALATALATLLTLNFVMLGFVITKEEALPAALATYRTIALGIVGAG